MDKLLTIKYQEYSDISMMANEDRELINEAVGATSSSYSPYSNFRVGAAVRLADGTVVRGANQENAAFPSGLCAERTAMFAAAAQHPGVVMESIAIAAIGTDGFLTPMPATPCGACRQVMAQYQKVAGKNISIILHGSEKTWKFEKVDDILPLIFDSI